MKRIVSLALLVLYAGSAHAILAILVSQSYGTLPSGNQGVICTYNAMGNQFRVFQAIGTLCAPSIDVP